MITAALANPSSARNSFGKSGYTTTIIGRDTCRSVTVEGDVQVMPRDPVCGAVLDENTTKFKITHDGETYYFCCLKCKKRFKRHADKFVK